MLKLHPPGIFEPKSASPCTTMQSHNFRPSSKNYEQDKQFIVVKIMNICIVCQMTWACVFFPHHEEYCSVQLLENLGHFNKMSLLCVLACAHM